MRRARYGQKTLVQRSDTGDFGVKDLEIGECWLNMTEQTCPLCNSSMVLRTARRGRNAGGQFWGCSNYPQCRGIRPADEAGSPPPEDESSAYTVSQSNKRFLLPVHWQDGLPRGEFHSEYVSIGAVPGFVLDQSALCDPDVRHVASQALLLSKRSQLREVSEHQKAIASIIQKLLTRGTLPLSTLRVEEALVGLSGVADHTVKLDERNIEVGWKWTSKPPRSLTREIAEAFSYRGKITDADVSELTEEFLDNVLDGDNEKYFFSKWLTRTIGKDALHWVTPQAELDLILASSGIEQSGQRKIDFLFSHPNFGTVAIELDGDDHAEKVRSDAARNAELAQAGIKTFRIPNNELKLGEGPHLSELERALRELGSAHQSNKPTGMPMAIYAASMVARFQFVLARALSAGLFDLGVGTWSVGIRSDFIEMEVFQSAADDFADMVASLSALYSEDSLKLTINCEAIGNTSKLHDLTVAALATESPLTIGLRNLKEDYAFCPAFAPVKFATDAQNVASRTRLNCDDAKKVEAALLFFLQNLFRKRAFRELQAEAVINALKGQDTVTLLPTGAGKSIIYQLAGMLQSGITLVVDPIVALIEDQILGLARVGIDKAGAPPSGFNNAEDRRKWLRAVERGDYQFIHGTRLASLRDRERSSGVSVGPCLKCVVWRIDDPLS